MPLAKMSPVTEAEVTQPQTQETDNAPIPKVKEFKNSILTPELCASVRLTTSEIIAKISDIAQGEIEIGTAMLKLKKEFSDYAKAKDISETEIRKAFADYIQVVFGFMPARAYDYMTVAEHEVASKLKLSISSLVELSRLSPDVLSELLESNDEANLRTLTYREIKALVKSKNQRALKKEKTPKTMKADSVHPLGIPESTLDRDMKSVIKDLEESSLPEVSLNKVYEMNQRFVELSEQDTAFEVFRIAFDDLVFAFGKSPTTEAVDQLVAQIVDWQTQKYQERKVA